MTDKICINCKKLKYHHAKGMCRICYCRLKWRSLSKKEQKRRKQMNYQWVVNNRERYNKTMREIMRKRNNIDPKDYRYKPKNLNRKRT